MFNYFKVSQLYGITGPGSTSSDCTSRSVFVGVLQERSTFVEGSSTYRTDKNN